MWWRCHRVLAASAAALPSFLLSVASSESDSAAKDDEPWSTTVYTTYSTRRRRSIPIHAGDANEPPSPTSFSSPPLPSPSPTQVPPILTAREAVAELSERITQLRQHASGAKIGPPIACEWKDHNTVEMMFRLPKSVDSKELLKTLLQHLDRGATISVEDHLSFFSTSNFSLVLKDPSTALTVTLTTANNGTVMVAFENIGGWKKSQLEAFLSVYQLATTSEAGAFECLEKLGVIVYRPSSNEVSWNDLGGSASAKRDIQNTVVMSLLHAELCDEVSNLTRVRPSSNRPKAVLFTGSPGVGKTSAARIIASTISVPLVIIPLEAITSKYYGESEKILAEVFDAIDHVGDAIVFIDEIDSIAPSRSGEIHEATRRILSVILQRVEGISKGSGKSILIGATNRKQDLDSALLSRFDLVIRFHEPDVDDREEIFQLYAKHLSEQDVQKLSRSSEGFTGRDIKDLCAHAERMWVSELVSTGKQESASAPPLTHYEAAIRLRQEGLLH